MRQTISLGVDDLAVTRFAVSSLAETVFALQFLRTGDANPVNLPWLRRARHDLSSCPLPSVVVAVAARRSPQSPRALGTREGDGHQEPGRAA
jgi:hypothetical protein